MFPMNKENDIIYLHPYVWGLKTSFVPIWQKKLICQAISLEPYPTIFRDISSFYPDSQFKSNQLRTCHNTPSSRGLDPKNWFWLIKPKRISDPYILNPSFNFHKTFFYPE